MIAFKESPLVLTDGAIETRAVFEFHRDLANFEVFTLLGDARGREIITEIYASYADIAKRYGYPMQLGTPTWRASRNWTNDVAAVNEQAVQLVRDAAGARGATVIIAGEIGPSKDGYDPSGALSLDDAHAYHREQTRALAASGSDILFAPTFPAIDELHGAARAMAETKLPFAVAPMVRPDGMMMDGTPLAEAIARLDADPAARPWQYMLGCLYPTHAATALETLFRAAPSLAHRVVGLKANGSPLPAESLDGSTTLQTTEPDVFARDMWAVAENFGLHVLGGCCGTDVRHIESIASLANVHLS
ncbi:MAG: homocysteine S-methyltransferase family protein [Candidatus Eremiobacteraeota bacterium]|nr:homocysteine S-methyltransferase family protein [Candidatus Eremiobacteraeota bacterium]